MTPVPPKDNQQIKKEEDTSSISPQFGSSSIAELVEFKSIKPGISLAKQEGFNAALDQVRTIVEEMRHDG